MLRYKNYRAVVLVMVCCWTTNVFAPPNPICYRLNPKCALTEQPGGTNCPAGEEPWLLKDNAPSHCGGVHGSLSQEARVTIRNHLLARGVFPDMLSVSGDIEVSLKDAPTVWEVGKLYSLTAEIKNKFGTSMQGKAVELLVLDGKQVLSALQQGEGSDSKIRGVWQGSQVSFNDLSLIRDLPQNAQLAVVARDEQGSYMFYAQTFPISSSAATD